eukprot:75671-Chlamydomonas_euryale.AAC.1
MYEAMINAMEEEERTEPELLVKSAGRKRRVAQALSYSDAHRPGAACQGLGPQAHVAPVCAMVASGALLHTSTIHTSAGREQHGVSVRLASLRRAKGCCARQNATGLASFFPQGRKPGTVPTPFRPPSPTRPGDGRRRVGRSSSSWTGRQTVAGPQQEV